MKICGEVSGDIKMNVNKANFAQNKKLCNETYKWAQFLNQTNRPKVYVAVGNECILGLANIKAIR